MTLINGSIEEKKDRTAVWWRGASLGRPVLDVRTKETKNLLEYKGELPPGEYCPNYTTRSLDYRLFVEESRIRNFRYYGEAIPNCSADLGHVDLILTLDDVDIIQWEPGASHTIQGEGTWHPMWFPLYRRFLDSGKKIFLHHFNYADRFGDLKRVS